MQGSHNHEVPIKREIGTFRFPVLVAAMRAARPDVTLQEMCKMLEEMHEPTPRGRATWYPSSVKSLLERAERLGIGEGRGGGNRA